MVKSMIFGAWLMGITAVAVSAGESLAIPGGVTDQVGKVAFITDPKGGIVAVDLTNGTVVWRTQDGTKPLAVARNRLAVFAPEKDLPNTFRIWLLDTDNKGRVVKKSELIALPDWAKVGNGLDQHALGIVFSIRADLVDGDLLVKWNAGTYYYGGAAPSPEILNARTRNATGMLKFNLESGKAETVDADREVLVPVDLLPFDRLPKDVQAFAKREKWLGGRVVGPRVFGYARRPGDAPLPSIEAIAHYIQVLDAATGELLWEREFETQLILSPPP